VPLAAEHEVVHIPSASALAALRRRQARRRRPPGLLAVIADPVFDRSDPRLGAAPASASAAAGTASPPPRGPAERLGRLPYSGEEARALAELAGGGRTVEALGLAATREAAVDPSLGGFRYLHLATHGVLDGERPELSRLVFSRFDARGRPRPGDLYAYELFDLELAADLVVLSGCETALGQEVRGEGLEGLTQGFFHAGAAAVLVSLWRVDDRATAELMARFYRELLRNGRSPAAALRRAQLDLRGETGRRAPYFWAGFVLRGEPGDATGD
jgi:CHAT domain-containing protein